MIFRAAIEPLRYSIHAPKMSKRQQSKKDMKKPLGIQGVSTETNQPNNYD